MPALVRLVMRGRGAGFPCLDATYSSELRRLFTKLLSPKPRDRPDIVEILRAPIVVTACDRVRDGYSGESSPPSQPVVPEEELRQRLKVPKPPCRPAQPVAQKRRLDLPAAKQRLDSKFDDAKTPARPPPRFVARARAAEERVLERAKSARAIRGHGARRLATLDEDAKQAPVEEEDASSSSSSSEDEDSSDEAEEPKQPQPKKEQAEYKALGGGWWLKRDAASDRWFYVNEASGHSQWDLPDGVSTMRRAPTASTRRRRSACATPCGRASPRAPAPPRARARPVALRGARARGPGAARHATGARAGAAAVASGARAGAGAPAVAPCASSPGAALVAARARAGAALVVGTGSAPVAAGRGGAAPVATTRRALGARAGRGVVARLPRGAHGPAPRAARRPAPAAAAGASRGHPLRVAGYIIGPGGGRRERRRVARAQGEHATATAGEGPRARGGARARARQAQGRRGVGRGESGSGGGRARGGAAVRRRTTRFCPRKVASRVPGQNSGGSPRPVAVEAR